MSYNGTVYVCFDADNDFTAYSLMKAWKQNENIDFNFDNAHEINKIRENSSEETIKTKLRERMKDSDVLVVLIGEHTKNLYKFVRWEMQIALNKGIPIIAVNLNQKRTCDYELCPPIIRDEVTLHISYSPKILQFALENYPAEYIKNKTSYKIKGEHVREYNSNIYTSVGL